MQQDSLARMALTNEQVERFVQDGYLVIEDFYSPNECDRLRERAFQIVAEADLTQHPVITFNTRDNQQSRTDYFITSGDKIRFFFEEGAVDENGKLKAPPEKALNKIGHALHALDSEFQKATLSEKVKAIAGSLGLKKPAVVQSMVIFKQAKFGGVVNCHQDSTFLYTTPMNLTGFWIALEDADLENGCLWFVPGSHRNGITQRMIRTTQDGCLGTTVEGKAPSQRAEEFVAVPVKRGTLVLIHGEVVHKSGENVSERSRNIYTFHLYDAGTSEWSEDNWLQPTQSLPFTLLY